MLRRNAALTLAALLFMAAGALADPALYWASRSAITGVAAASPDIVDAAGGDVRPGCNWLIQLVDLGSGEVLFTAPAGAIMDVGHGAAYGVFYATLMDVGPRRGRTVGTRVFDAESEATANRWALFSNTTTLTWETTPSSPATFTYGAGRVTQGQWRDIDNRLSAEDTGARTGSSAPMVVPLNLAVDRDLGSLSFVLTFDPALLRAVSYRAAGRTTAIVQPAGIDQAGGRIRFTLGQWGGEAIIAAGSGQVAEAIFELQPSVDAAASTALTLGDVQASTPGGASQALSLRHGRLEVVDGSTHTLTYLPGDHGSIVGPTPQTIEHGADGVAVTAVPAFGYHFEVWDDTSTANPRLDTHVTANRTLTAAFMISGPVPPNGGFRARVTATDTAARRLWDLTGAYSTTAKGNPLALSLVHEPTGRLTGTATYSVAPNTTITMPIKGSVKGTRGSLTMKGSLQGANAAQRVSVALTLDLTLDTTSRQLVGRLTGSIQENGAPTLVNDDLTLAIPGDMDGTWTLQFQLGQAGRTVTGTAELTLSNGATHALVVRGRTGANNRAVLSLAGAPSDPAARAIALKTTITPMEGGWASIESFSGRGYGQALGW